METITTQVCVAGGGPAGVMLGVLLAREGVEVVVLEKHIDFFRDFRGDTVHPSTLDLIDALGLRERFDAVPHTPLPVLDAVINGIRLRAVDFASLPGPNRFITLMPQWDLLDLLADEGARHPSFALRMCAEATGVLRRGGRVCGVTATTAAGPLEVRAAVTIAADGRASTLRRVLDLHPKEVGVPADVLWLRLPRPQEPLPDTLAWVSEHAMLITIPRPGYLQCGLVIPKGAWDGIRAEGLAALRRRILSAAPRLRETVDALASLDDVKLLSVQIDRLPQWHLPGVLCIGDAAHAMSPAFGVGINYAIQDAVAAAQRLAPVLRAGGSDRDVDAACAAVQRRRVRPTVRMQRMQRVAHRVIASGRGVRLLHDPPTVPERAFLRFVLPVARPVLARVIGRGFRPERLERRPSGGVRS